ncbi:MAG: hypothetical protein ACOCUA_02890 [archaeon]
MLTQRQRVTLLPVVDRLAQQVGQYAAYQLDEREFVGTVTEVDDAEGVASLLEEYGYEHGGLAALKYHPETGAPDEGSYRKVDPDRPRWQWHVHLWSSDDGVEVYSHYEFRPDLRPVAGESTLECLDRLREHYDPTWDVNADDEEATYLLGEACDDVHDLTGGD